jgi:hypothetical protein
VIDLPNQRKRLYAMIAADVVCALVALGAFVGYTTQHALIWLAVFALALVAGFAAQGWLIMGLVKSSDREDSR